MEEKQKIVNIAIEYHEQAKTYWQGLYRAYFTKDSSPRMKRGIDNISSIIQSLVLKPTINTEDMEQLDEVQKLSKELAKIYKQGKKQIKEAMRDGIITNNGVVLIAPNYNNKKIIINRRDPHTIAKYMTADQQEFVIDLVEKKVWTEEKIYHLDKNNKILKQEQNLLGFIPFAFYTPHRIEFGGTKYRSSHESVYGQGEFELKNIQENLDTIAELMAFALKMQLEPPITYSGNISEIDIANLQQPGGLVKVQSVDNVKPYLTINQESIDALIFAKNQSIKDFRERTSQTEFTTGVSTSSSASGSLIQQHKESMLTILKDFEDAYFEMFERLTLVVAYYLSNNNILTKNINFEDITIEKWNKDLNASESLAFLQNFSGMLGMLPNGEAKIEIMHIVMKSVMKKYVTINTEEPEQVMRAFDVAFKQAQKEINQVNKQETQGEKSV